MNEHGAIRTAEMCCDGLIRQLAYREDVRHNRAAPRYTVRIIVLGRVKAIDALAVNEDVCEQGVVTLDALVYNLIGVLTSAFRRHDDLLLGLADVLLQNRLTGFGGHMYCR